jgi:putative spermidine/putrescine transport system ATP-binding protein
VATAGLRGFLAFPTPRAANDPLGSPALTSRGVGVRMDAIHKVYGHTAVVRDISLDIHAGEFFTLLGPSGSGKTTLLQMIAGFVAPSGGDVLIDGRSVSRVPPQHREVGMVFQNYALFPHLTVFENIAFPLRVRRMVRSAIRERVDTLLNLFQLEGLGARLPRQLSGGQQQRVAVARALVFEPRALLMDEPLGALDKKLREEMQLELKHLQRRVGATFVYVTHDQDEALAMSDRVAIMRKGAIEQVGDPREIYERPATLFVAGFLGETNLIAGLVKGLEPDGEIAVETHDGGRIRGTALSPVGVGQSVVAAIRPERIAVVNDEPGTATVEGLVDDAVYLGDSIRWKVRTAQHGAVVLKEQNRSNQQNLRIGERVHLRWVPTDVRVFAAAG